MAVIRDVAKLAGVSISTVSKYLNNPDSMSGEYKVKVANAIKELDYKPSSLARSMRTNKSNLIALVVPEIVNIYYSEIYSTISAMAEELGYTIILYTTDERTEVLKRYLDKITSHGVDGIIICFLDEDEMIEYFEMAGLKIPIVLMGWDVHNTRFNSVVVDMFDGVYRATLHQISLGHTQIAYIGGTDGSRISKEKYNGYLVAMQDNNLKVDHDLVASGKYRFQTGYSVTKSFMNRVSRPTAIVCANDVLAIGALKYLVSHEVKVPEECSVIGFDGIQLASIYQPALSTMSQPIQEMGCDAVRLLVSSIDNPTGKKKQIIYKTTLNIRKTTSASGKDEFEF